MTAKGLNFYCSRGMHTRCGGKRNVRGGKRISCPCTCHARIASVPASDCQCAADPLRCTVHELSTENIRALQKHAARARMRAMEGR